MEELVEAKWWDDAVSRSLVYYAERLKPARATQIVGTLKRPYDQSLLRVTNAIEYFARP